MNNTSVATSNIKIGMQIEVENLSKRYFYDWIIRDFSHVFSAGSITGINGINGSGKSTMIKLLSGYLSASKGKIEYKLEGTNIDRSMIYKQLSLAAPYTDLIQEYDVKEMFNFHAKFKSFRIPLDYKTFLGLVHLEGNTHKQIQYYSSGMKQRLQLAFSILSDSKLLLLDEPTSYLDQENKAWYYQLLNQQSENRTIIIASNDDSDFDICDEVIML
ncbi:MAG: ATP-binding cassette domain-containing protein [Saprospiraceae bacterium]